VIVGLEEPAVPVRVAEVAVPIGALALGSPSKKVPTGPFRANRKAFQGSAKSLRTGGIETEAVHLCPA